jgi:pyruvate ferredoxin oxidoreductase alpha subunit
MLTQEQVDQYLPAFKPFQRLDAADPISFGMYATPEYYLEFRYETDQAMKRAQKVFSEAGKEFLELFGRNYVSPVESYRLEDADTALVAMGSISGTVKDAVDELRAAGEKVGLLRIRNFRPFPSAEIRKALSGVSRVAVLDKNISLGSKGAVALEVRDALYGSQVSVLGYILGLGGRDVRKKDIAAIVSLARAGKGDQFYGLRTELI